MRHSLLLAGVLVAALAAGCAGEDGKDGANGLPGQDGAPGADGQDGVDGTNGTDGTNGSNGTNGTSGTNGTNGVWHGTLKVTATVSGTPVAGVQLAFNPDPDLGTYVTAANGVFQSAEFPVGSYVMTVVAPGALVASKTEYWVSVGAGLESDVAVTLTGVPGAVPTISSITPAMTNVGFGKTIDLHVVAADTDSANLTYTWTKTGGPAVTLTNANSPDATVTLATLPAARVMPSGETVALPDEMGVVSFTPDNAGRYTFSVKVTDPEGHVATKTVSVSSMAFNTTGLRQVAHDQPVYVRGIAGQASYNWTLTTKPGTSAATLSDATTRFANFKPDVVGKYVLTESVSGKTLEIFANDWNGSQGTAEASCTGCHNGTIAPDNFTPYSHTGHAGMLHMVLTDPAEDHYGKNCLACHTVGYDPTANNNGFDDRAGTWSPDPNGSQANWDRFVAEAPNAIPVANIQCENCHGPQGGVGSSGHMQHATTDGTVTARTSLNATVCASCHSSGAHHDRYRMWEQSAHSNRELAVADGTRNHCGRCHGAQGFIAWVDQMKARNRADEQIVSKIAGNTYTFVADAADPFNPAKNDLVAFGMNKEQIENVTCAACHDPHDATNPAQLRLYGSLPRLPNGLEGIQGAGSGAICMACHNTRNGLVASSAYPSSNAVLRSDAATGAVQNASEPHAPGQTDVLYGVSAYFVSGPMPSAHLAVADTCVGCHMKLHPEEVETEGTNHTFEADSTICASCHSDLVTGDALAASIDNLIVTLEGKIIAKAQADIAAGITANTTLKVTPVDERDDCTASAAATIDAAPASIELITTHGNMALLLHFAAPVTATFPSSCAGSAQYGTSRNLDEFVVALTNVKTPAATPAQLWANGHAIYKAFWNYLLIEDEGSHGVHNPSFAKAALNGAINAL
jgi:hypothetical protein